jgi:hypothetical protein
VQLSPENILVVSLRCCQVRGPRRAGHTWSQRACSVTPGSENMANGHEGSPGTWETLPSPSECRLETRLTNSRKIPDPASGAGGDERRTHRWYRQAKTTKCGEKGGRESECLIVPLKRGNHTAGTPWREGGTVSRHRWRETRRVLSNPWTCHRNFNGSRRVPRT